MILESVMVLSTARDEATGFGAESADAADMDACCRTASACASSVWSP